MRSHWDVVTCTTTLGKHTMQFQRWLPEDTPRGTVLCVHGLTRNSYDFERLAWALAGEGWQVIAPDIVGRGRSDRLGDAALYNYATYAADLLTLIAHEKLSGLTWVGTSMGGILGMMVAAQQPRLVSKLILNDVGAFIPKAALERITTYVATPPVFASLTEAEAYCRATYTAFGLTEAADWEVFTENSVTSTDDGYVMAYDPAIGRMLTVSPAADVNLWPLWEAVRAPTLVLRGALSDLLRADTAQMMCLKPQAEEVVIAGCGHAPSLMVPDQIAVVVDYVRREMKAPGSLLDVMGVYSKRFKAGLAAIWPRRA